MGDKLDAHGTPVCRDAASLLPKNKKLSYRGDSARRRSLRRSRLSIKVTVLLPLESSCATSLKWIILTYGLSCTVSIVDYWSKFPLSSGGTSFRGREKPLKTRLWKLASRNYKVCSVVSCKKYFDILNHVGVDHR